MEYVVEHLDEKSGEATATNRISAAEAGSIGRGGEVRKRQICK